MEENKNVMENENIVEEAVEETTEQKKDGRIEMVKEIITKNKKGLITGIVSVGVLVGLCLLKKKSEIVQEIVSEEAENIVEELVLESVVDSE